MTKVFIGVGSNLGSRAGYLEFAKKELLSVAGLEDFRYSQVYETEPLAVEGGSFLNAVWSFETSLSPRDLLEKIQKIEINANRQRNKPNEARTLDLDILFYGDQVIREPGMTVPHPRLHERAFVLVPFCDLEPGWEHPELKRTMKEILKGLNSGKRGTGYVKQIRSALPVDRSTKEK
ncbi:MAG: 2-amino-4-hydroxy-6-hydroxymethyldihydropteridine diphosphokinase [Omnitrophica bacterium RIFOXYB12_FULL_50_7]|nr:MAG: 2-amino-4-hydroxy-6-hydroxymethyldihydropteridine diphosphokinase [Omnitrophica bacterium RIFOXYB12_FULL_50_7]